MKKIALLFAIFAFAFSTAFAAYVEIGDGTTTTNYVPLYGLYDYSWSSCIYLQSEIGSAIDINQISYNVGNTVASYETVNQKIYMKHTTDATYTVGDWPNPDSTGFTLVFEGAVTWTGPGWFDIPLDTNFSYNGTDNLIVYWENNDGTYVSGYPKFNYTSQADRVVRKHQDNTFPAITGTIDDDLSNIRLHYPSTGPDISLATTSYDFGYVNEGETGSFDLTIINNGLSDLVVSAATVNAPFYCSYTGTIPAGATDVATITFEPTAATDPSFTEVLSFTSNATSGSGDITLTGISIPAGYSTIDFEDTTYPPAGWTIENIQGNDWARYSSSTHAYDGTYSARLNYYSSSGYHSSESRLITPKVYADAGDYISFYTKKYSSTSTDTLLVEWSSDMITWNELTNVALTNAYQNITVDLSGIGATDTEVYLAFHGKTEAASSRYIYIDAVIMPEVWIGPPAVPANPTPADGATYIDVTTNLSWEIDFFTENVDLYFGTDQTLVTNNDPSVQVLSGVLANTFDPAGNLDPLTTYYWKVIANNSVPTDTSTPGPVWSFTTKPDVTQTIPWGEDFETGSMPWYFAGFLGSNAQAYVNANAANSGSYGLEAYADNSSGYTTPSDLAAAWTSAQTGGANEEWTQYFDVIVDLTTATSPGLKFWYAMGYQYNDNYNNFWVVADDGSGWTELFGTQTAGAATPWTQEVVDLTSYAGNTLNLRFFHNNKYDTNYLWLDDISITEVSSNPDPPMVVAPLDAAINVALDTNLEWINGYNTDNIDLYFGTDETLVTNLDASVQVLAATDTTMYQPVASLDYTTDYYWRVVENNALDAQTVGPVWSFTTMGDPTRTIPFAEDFETGLVPWYMSSILGVQNGTVYTDTTAVHGGMYDLVCHTDGTSGWTNPDSLGHAWILAQPGGAGFDHTIYNDIMLDLTATSNPVLNFWYSMGFNYQDYYNNFWVVVDDGTTTTELMATQTDGGLLDWTEFDGSLAAFAGQTVTLRFVHYAKYEENFLKIDDISIDEGPALPTLVINEIHYNPSTAQGDDLDWEFVEIYNITNAPIDLTGYTLDEDDGSSNSVALTGYTIAANGFLVITAGDTTYSWLTCPVINNNGYFGLSNSGNDLSIRNNGVEIDHVQYDDAAPWPTSPDGSGPSLELIDPALDNEDPANWQASWVLNGTPGAVNSVEPDPIPYTIYQIQSEVHTGDLAITNGVVTGVFPSENLFTIQDGTGAFSGIWVSSADAVAMGDDVTVTGVITENFDLTQINASDIVINSTGNILPAPAEITTGAAATEDYEGVLVKVIGTCTNDNLGYGEWEVDDGITDAPVAVNDFNVAVTPVLGDLYKVIGPVDYSFSAFKIEPRVAADVENLSGETAWPPLNLDYVVANQTDVTLSWEAPHVYGWNAYFENLSHLSWAGDQRATLFDVTDYGFSYPMEITGIQHLFYEHSSYPWGADTTFTFIIYDADGSTVLYQSAVMTAEQYPTPTEVAFPAVTLNDNFYVAIAPTNPTTGYPSSAAEEDLVNSHGVTGDPVTGWTATDMEFATMINITAPASDGLTARHATLRHGKVTPMQPVTDNSTTAKIPDPIMGYNVSDALLGYNVYRDGAQINTDMVTDLTFEDTGLAEATYNYYVTALWDTGESVPSNAVDVTISIIPTITVDYTLTDSPAQQLYPNNTNPYSNTLTDFGWTTVTVTEDQVIYDWSMTLDWESVDYYGEGSMWVESPGGTETTVNVYNPTANGLVQGLLLTTDAFNGENMMGTWNVWLQDSANDGGHQVTNAAMHITYEDQGGSTLPSYDFEADDGGFTHSGTGDSWEWGIPTDPDGPAAAHSGQKVWATNLAGPFANSALFELVTPAIELPVNGCMLTFWHWFDMGGVPWDGGNVKITTDGGTTWTVIDPEGGYPVPELGSSNPLNPEPGYGGTSADWELATFDLLSYGNQTIQIKWEIGTTSVVENPGWYIDDVMFYEELFGGLSGVVTEATSAIPIDGAVVTIGDWSGTTDATGTYTIPGVLVGNYDGVTCEADGYITGVADGVAIAQGQTTTLDFILDYATAMVNPMSFTVTLDPGQTTDELMNIANSGTGDLDYSASVSFLTDQAFDVYDGDISRSVHAENFDIEQPVDRTSHKVRESATDEMWDLQFSYDVDTPSGLTGLAGAETDGDYFYTARWNGTEIAKFNLDGTFVETFSITGVSGLRDLAYDGQYFYGGAASTTIYQMDFDSQTLVGQITSPVAVRAIAYDDDNDAFWVNNWSEDLNLVDRNGSVLNTIAGPPSMYGSAYDNVTGGPYLWIFSGTTSGGGCQIEQFDIAAGTLTGVTHSVSGDLGDSAIAGGLFTHADIVSGTYTLGGLAQASPDLLFGYEIGTTESWLTLTNNASGVVAPGANLDVTLHFDATGLTAGDKTAEIVISNNAGDDVIVPVTLTVTGVVTYSLPFEEGFEDGALPSDWATEYGTGSTDWTFDTGGHSGNPAAAHTGTYNALFYAGSSTGNTTMLITPTIDAASATDLTLTFWHAQAVWAGDQDETKVYYRLSQTDPWVELVHYTDDTPDWTERTVAIPQTSSTLQIAFEGIGGYGYGVCVDDVLLNGGTVTTNPPSNLVVTDLGYATWDAPAADNSSLFKAARGVAADNTRDLIGYNVYLNGTFVEMVTVTHYQYTNLTPAANYTAGVTALYDEGESTMITEGFTYTPVVNPPSNLVATVNNYNDVNLTWEQPTGTGGVLSYHNGYDANGIGTGSAVDFSCAARFTADELGDLYGNAINNVRIVIHSADFSGVTVKVWEGGSFGDPGTEVYSADVTASVVTGDWTEHTLTSPVTLVSGNEYWIGYEINATGDHPAAVDAGPMVADKGSWMYFNGAWDLLTNLGATLDYNWCIEGIVGPADTAVLAQKKVARTNAPAVLRNASFTSLPLTAAHAGKHNNAANTENTRSLLGYKIYRDGAEIHEITDPSITTWDDMGLDAGTYDYHVTAVYDDGESVASNTENVTITLGAPVNFNAVSQGANGTIMCTWTAPAATRNLTEYKIYRDGVEIGTTSSLFYPDVNVVTGVYDYHATAVYSDTYESDPSNVVQVDHTSAPTPVVPVVTALDGNYPNPFNPTTEVKFSLSEPGAVRIDVFNIKGEKVRTLVDGEMEAAFHTVTWNGNDDSGRNVGSGVYFYKMRAGKYTSTKKMILMK